MTKHTTTASEVGRDRPVLLFSPDGDASGFYVISELNERGNNIPSSERVASENDVKGNGDIQIVLESSAFGDWVLRGDAPHGENIVALSYELYAPVPSDRREAGNDKGQDFCLNLGSPSCHDEELVLVLDVKGVQFVNSVFPARVRLREFNLSTDVFRGLLHKSARHHIHFGLSSVFVDRKLDNVFFGDERVHDIPVNMVQRTAKAVGSISDNERDMVWHGYFGFDRDGQIARAWIEATDEFEGALLKVFGDTHIKVVDVMTRAV